MGNLLQSCTDPKGERSKSSAFDSTDDRTGASTPGVSDDIHPSQKSSPQTPGSKAIGAPNGNSDANTFIEKQNAQAEAERQRALREEQARLELIVSTAGRDMVALHGRGGGGSANSLSALGSHGGGGSGMAYYDAGYAASVAQELLQSGGGGGGLHALFMEMELDAASDEEKSSTKTLLRMVQGRIPNSCVADGMNAVEVLSQRIDLREALAGSGNSGVGNDIDFFLEDVAESFLASVLSTKGRLFQGLAPIVENLP